MARHATASEVRLNLHCQPRRRSSTAVACVKKVARKSKFPLTQVLPVVSKFPRDQKYLLGNRMQSGLMDIMGTLIEANYARDRGALLHKGGKPWKPTTDQPARGVVSSLYRNRSETVTHGRRTGS